MEAEGHDPGEGLVRLRREMDDLRASRRRLAVADDAERRDLERELHGGVQQSLAALATSIQLATGLLGTEHGPMRARLDEIARDAVRALAEAQALAQHIYPPLLDSGGLIVAIRSAAASFGVPTRFDADRVPACPPVVARAVYVCCLEVLERATPGTEATVKVRADGGTIGFEIVAEFLASSVDVVRLRDRVEALGGWLTINSGGGRGTGLCGSIPLAG